MMAGVMVWSPRKHPHLRGENFRPLASTFSVPETSPPAWGKRLFDGCGFRRARNIPTCVGKTPRLHRSAPSRKKHPHLRGENAVKTKPMLAMLETSPPAWGKQQKSESQEKLPKKHPHLRGENLLLGITTRTCLETSPPAWGKRQRSDHALEKRRNIPTCVGKTKGRGCKDGQCQKHPHLRGENATVTQTFLMVM